MQFRGSMNELMRQASRMERKVSEARKANEDRTVEATGANEKVKVVAKLSRELVSITVDPDLLNEDRELALDAVVATANAAMKMASDAMDAEIQKVTGGLKIPGVT